MISTTGRMPVIAPPTATPVKPDSETGGSTTRSPPNSATSPERTLNGVPASATSPPKMHTRESRRISSASASRTACANVSSRSGINVLTHLIRRRIRRIYRKLHRCPHLGACLTRHRLQSVGVRVSLRQQPLPMQRDGIALRLPVRLFLLRPVVFAINVAHVMSAVAVRICLQECRTASRPRSRHQPRSNFIDCAYVLTVDGCRLQAEGSGARENCSCRRLAVMRVLVIKIVLANVNHRQLPELREIHHFI